MSGFFFLSFFLSGRGVCGRERRKKQIPFGDDNKRGKDKSKSNDKSKDESNDKSNDKSKSLMAGDGLHPTHREKVRDGWGHPVCGGWRRASTLVSVG